MDVSATIPKTKQDNQFGVEVTDRYTKLSKAIPTTQTTVITVDSLLTRARGGENRYSVQVVSRQPPSIRIEVLCSSVSYTPGE